MENNNKSFRFVFLAFILAIIILIAVMVFLPDSFSPQIRIVFGLIGMAIVLWVMEPIPVSMTSIILLLGFVFSRIATFEEAVSGFASNGVFLCLGGYMMAQGVNETLLGKRLAYILLVRFGSTIPGVLAGIIVAMFVFSFFIPGSSVKIFLLVPPVMAIIDRLGELPKSTNIKALLFLTLAYSALISSVGIMPSALINIITVDLIKMYLGVSITYFQWLVHFLPASIILLFCAWLILLRLLPPEVKEIPGGIEVVRKDLAELGKLTNEEFKCILILTVTVLLWMTQVWHGFPTSVPALLCPILMCFPGTGFTSWNKLLKIDWQSVIFIGGVLSTMSIISQSSAISDISSILIKWEWLAVLFTVPFLAVFSIVILAHVLHLFVANSSVVAALMVPLVIQFCQQLSINPLVFAMVGGLSSLLGFILTIETVPNIITYSFGYYKAKDLVTAGVFMSLVSAIVYGGMALTLWPRLGLM